MAPSCKWPIIKLKVCDVINWPKYCFLYWNVYQRFRYTVLPLTIYCFFLFPIVEKEHPGSEPWKRYKKMSENLESLFNLLWIYFIDSTAWCLLQLAIGSLL